MDKENVIYIDRHRHRHRHTDTHTHTGILLSHKKNEILPFAATWMYLGGIRLSEISQTERNTV